MPLLSGQQNIFALVAQKLQHGGVGVEPNRGQGMTRFRKASADDVKKISSRAIFFLPPQEKVNICRKLLVRILLL